MTDAGEWRTAPLGSVATLQRGFDLPARKRVSGRIPVVSSSGISGWHDRAMVTAPGVVTGRYGTIGRVFYLCRDFWPLNTTLWVSNFHGSDPMFVYYLLQRVDFATHSGKSGVPGVNRNDLHTEEVRVPRSSVEQRRIAVALSDTDAVIAKLVRLVAKKQAIKQGMMQQLMTGATRLPGFDDEWRELPLAEVSTMKGRIGWQGLTQEEFTSDARHPFLITGMNFKDGAIRWTDVYHVSEERYAIAPEIQLRPDDVLMTKDGTMGKLLYVESIPRPGKATLNSHLLVFRPKDDAYIPRFLYYQLASPRFAAHIELHKSGTTFFGISQESVGKYQMLLPSLEEQAVIAGHLSDTDNEIRLLQVRLTKARDVRPGMMQEVLTGRIRLPVQEPAS